MFRLFKISLIFCLVAMPLYGSNMNLCVLISFLFLCGGSVVFVALGIKTAKSDNSDNTVTS